jgi:hypothetical protein
MLDSFHLRVAGSPREAREPQMIALNSLAACWSGEPFAAADWFNRSPESARVSEADRLADEN